MSDSLDPDQDQQCSVCPNLGTVYVFRIFFCHLNNFTLKWNMMNMIKFEPVHEISNNVACATGKASDQPAHTRSLIRAFASRFSIL